MYGGCQKKICEAEGGDEGCVSPTHIENDPDYVGVKCYKIYKKYYDYYGSFTYADKWVTAAVEGTVFLQGGTVTNRLADFSQAPPIASLLPLPPAFDTTISLGHPSPLQPQPPASLPTPHLPPPPSTLPPPSLHHHLSTPLRPRTRRGRRRRSQGRLSWQRGCTQSASTRMASTTAPTAMTSLEVATTTRRMRQLMRGMRASPSASDPSRAPTATAGR